MIIPPLPPNFGFALVAVPTWRWEEDPVPPVEEAPSADGNAAAEGGKSSTPQGRYVFAGYEWQSQIQWSLFPDASWENAFGVQAEELQQAALRSERERHQSQQPVPRPHGAEARPPSDVEASHQPENTPPSES